MKRACVDCALFAIVFSLPISVLGAGTESPDLNSAVQPLEEGVPEVAVSRLKDLLATSLSDADRRTATIKLSQALVGSGDSEGALKLLDDPGLHGVAGADFWRAQALASLKRWPEALVEYDQVAQTKSGFTADALIGKAEALRALDRKDEALKTFTSLFGNSRWGLRARYRAAELFLDKHDPGSAGNVLAEARPRSAFEKQERHFLRGRIEAELNHPEKAIELLQSILKKPEETSHSMLIAALFAVTDIHLQLKAPEVADDVLEEFIEHHPMDPNLAEVFAKLDQIYQSERKPSRNELARWTRDPTQPRRALAQWYLARAELRADHRGAALDIFRALKAGGVKYSALAGGYLEFAQLELEDRRFDDALAILNAALALQPNPTQLTRINWLAAETRYQAKQFAVAARDFERIAHSSGSFEKMALFNAALGWLQIGNDTQFLAQYQALSGDAQDDETRAELLLEQGLTEAAQGNAKATSSLQNFLRDFPKNKRVSEAWVALAELAFHSSPPRLDDARGNLKRAMESHPTDAATERADYLNIWIEDTSANGDAKVILLTNQFLQKHAGSPFASEVRMKLAEAYYRRQDFANAQTQFEILAQQDPNGALAEKALFFAAESAMASMGTDSLDRALTLFNEVVRKNGDLKWAARNEQAVIERRLGKPQDAMALYDEVLKENAKPGEKREALCGKGDIYFEMGPADPQNYKRAIESYDQLLADPQAPPHWRNQALFKKGVCLEKTDDHAGALTTFYRVIEEEGHPDRSREFFWFYKAGFNAARLLEDEQKWSSAAAIYQKLASAGGTRSEEAKTRLTQLRLEHFLWDQ